MLTWTAIMAVAAAFGALLSIPAFIISVVNAQS
jgi:hypothetical protein